MDKNPQTNALVTVAQTTVGDPKGARPGAPQGAPQGGGLPNPAVIIRRALAHWPVAVIVMVLGVIATSAVVRLRKPIYKSETVVVYRSGVLSGEGGQTEVLRTLGAKLKETLMAQSNLKKLIDEMHLYPDIVDKRGYVDAGDQFRKNIDFKARSNDTFAISFQGTTRDEAQAVTARLADMLVEENAKARQERAKETTDFLEAEKKRGDEDLAQREKELAQFQADHPEFVADGSGRAGAAVRAEQKKLGTAAAAEQQAARLRALAAGGSAIRSAGPVGLGPGAPPVDPVLLAAKTQATIELNSAKKDLEEKRLRFTNQHPDVHAAEARVTAAESAVQKADDAIRAAAPPPVPVAPPPADTSSAKAIAKKPAAGGGSTAKPQVPEKAAESTLVTLETEWNRLDREVTKLRQQQTQLETKVFQAQMAASSEIGGYSATISILDPAFKPTGPSGAPNRIIIFGGFAASLFIGIFLAAARGMFLDDRLFDASEIDGLGLVPVLGIVPKPKAERKAKTRGARA